MVSGLVPSYAASLPVPRVSSRIWEEVQRARDDSDQRGEGGYILDPRDPGDRDGARGHGRSPELGPVEICRLVPRIAPAAAT